MFYGDYDYYKKLKFNNLNKDDEEILSAEKWHPDWLYKVTREYLNNLIKFKKIKIMYRVEK